MHASTPTPRASAVDASAGPTAAGIADAVWRKRRWVVLPVAIVVALTIGWLMVQTPLYRSTAKVLVESQETVYTRPQNVTSVERDLLDQEAIRSQVQLILAGDLTRTVIEQLDLDENPEFAGSTGSPGSLLSLVGLGGRKAAEDRVLESFYDKLSVYQVDQSRVIAIEFSSRDPLLAAKVANTLATEYLEMQRAVKRDTTRAASKWLDDQIAQLRERVEEAERKVEVYRAAHGLFTGGRNNETTPQTLSTQQLSELATQLATVRAEKSSAEARARLLRDQLESGRPVEAADVLNSALIQGLVGEAVRRRAEIAQLSSTLGPRHPRMQELSAQLADLRSQIRDEVSKIVRSLEADAAVASERERDLLGELDKLKTASAEANEQEVELRALEREAKAQRDLLESMLGRYREASTRDSLEALPADARIISRAAPASEPYFPKTMLTIMAVLVATTVLAVGTIVSLELVRLAGLEHGGSPRDPADPTSRGSRIKTGFVPVRPDRMRIALGAGAAPGVAAAGHGSLEALCAVALGDGNMPRFVLVSGTGAAADEAAFALSLARGLSSRGPRVALVDTGFGLHQFDNVIGEGRPGLSDLLVGRCDFGEVLFRDPRSRVHVLPAGAAYETASDELRNGVDLVIGALTHTYDVVVMLQPTANDMPVFAERMPDVGMLVVSAAQPEENFGSLRDGLLRAGIPQVTIVSLTAAESVARDDALAA